MLGCNEDAQLSWTSRASGGITWIWRGYPGWVLCVIPSTTLSKATVCSTSCISTWVHLHSPALCLLPHGLLGLLNIVDVSRRSLATICEGALQPHASFTHALLVNVRGVRERTSRYSSRAPRSDSSSIKIKDAPELHRLTKWLRGWHRA